MKYYTTEDLHDLKRAIMNSLAAGDPAQQLVATTIATLIDSFMEDRGMPEALITDEARLYDLMRKAISEAEDIRIPSTAEARETGYWIGKKENDHINYYCSRCGVKTFKPHRFCPNCGTDMRLPEDNEANVIKNWKDVGVKKKG